MRKVHVVSSGPGSEESGMRRGAGTRLGLCESVSAVGRFMLSVGKPDAKPLCVTYTVIYVCIYICVHIYIYRCMAMCIQLYTSCGCMYINVNIQI